MFVEVTGQKLIEETFFAPSPHILNRVKSEETKSQIKAHLWYPANSFFYNYKPSPRILRQDRVLQNLRKNKDMIITKLDKETGVVILDRKLYDKAI